MKYVWHMTNYHFKVFFNLKILLIIFGITVVLSFLSLAGSTALDFKGDQFDLYYHSIVEGFFHQSFLLMPIFLAFMLCILIGTCMATANKSGEDYISLVGGGTRLRMFLSKVLAMSVMIVLSLILYITLLEILSISSGLNIWNVQIILTYFKILPNLFIVGAWTILFTVILKSSFSGIITSLAYIFAIVANNGISGTVMSFFRKGFEVILPLSYYDTYAEVAMEKYMLDATPVHGMQWALSVILLLLVISGGIYMKQDL